jgi:PhnB protein
MNEELIIPAGHRKINPFFIIKNDALKFIEFAINVFDAKERIEVRTPDKDGKLIHAEVQIGDSTEWEE